MGDSGGYRNGIMFGKPTLAILPDGRSGGYRNRCWLWSWETVFYQMGDRGATATANRRVWGMVHFTRWEIGGLPQLSFHRILVHDNFTRWEIGGLPQPRTRGLRGSRILPDGRSGGYRNMR